MCRVKIASCIPKVQKKAFFWPVRTSSLASIPTMSWSPSPSHSEQAQCRSSYRASLGSKSDLCCRRYRFCCWYVVVAPGVSHGRYTVMVHTRIPLRPWKWIQHPLPRPVGSFPSAITRLVTSSDAIMPTPPGWYNLVSGSSVTLCAKTERDVLNLPQIRSNHLSLLPTFRQLRPISAIRKQL